MEKPTLLVLAAGMGSRYGGLKQIDPLGPNGEIIIDYSLYDARLAGFDRVVFVIKEELQEVFEEKVGRHVRPFMQWNTRFKRQRTCRRALLCRPAVSSPGGRDMQCAVPGICSTVPSASSTPTTSMAGRPISCSMIF